MLLHFVCSKLINCQRAVSEVEIFLQHFWNYYYICILINKEELAIRN